MIKIRGLCKNSKFTKTNVCEIARSVDGSQLLIVKAGTIGVYNADNFNWKIKNQHIRKSIGHKDVLENLNGNDYVIIYKDMQDRLYLIEDAEDCVLKMKQRRFKRSETYFDTFKNQFAQTQSCCCQKCSDVKQRKIMIFQTSGRNNIKWYTEHKRSCTTSCPPRPITLQPVNKKQYGVTVSNCIASPLSNTSYENERYPVIAQPSDQAEESSCPFSLQSNTSTDGLSFYRPHYSGLPSRLSNTSSVSIHTYCS